MWKDFFIIKIIVVDLVIWIYICSICEVLGRILGILLKEGKRREGREGEKSEEGEILLRVYYNRRFIVYISGM